VPAKPAGMALIALRVVSLGKRNVCAYFLIDYCINSNLNPLIMKKVFSLIAVIVASLLVFSFSLTPDTEEIVITITADKATKFDMFQDSKTTKGLKTPYEIRLKSTDSHFIFRSQNTKSTLKIEAKKKGAELYASWPVTVLLIKGDKLTTFGID
jgi:hypothetical protein